MKGAYFYSVNKASQSAVQYCIKEKKPCLWWVDTYFNDCLCNGRDELSFFFGMVSLVVWGVAEVPQIITNFRTKSTQGVSIFLLLTWTLGNILNLIGCLLEPATLPSQFYTAIIYTTGTATLILQSIYYNHFYSWLKCRCNKFHEEVDEQKKLLYQKPSNEDDNDSNLPNVHTRTQAGRESLYKLANPNSTPLDSDHDHPSSLEDDVITAPVVFAKEPNSQPSRDTARSAARGVMIVASATLPTRGNAFSEACIGFTSRRMLSENNFEHIAFGGQGLGWIMAAIYMVARVPQIVLNVRRGSVEGLNPLLFILALIANVTYALSIVIRSTEWDKIKANMPWLLDAIVCVVLDLFILMQYIYYKYMRRSSSTAGKEEQDFYYEEAQKS